MKNIRLQRSIRISKEETLQNMRRKYFGKTNLAHLPLKNLNDEQLDEFIESYKESLEKKR